MLQRKILSASSLVSELVQMDAEETLWQGMCQLYRKVVEIWPIRDTEWGSGVRICEIWGFSALLPDPEDEGPIDPSECQEPLIHWHGVASEKTGIIRIWLVTDLPVAVFDRSASNIPTWPTHLLAAHLLTATLTNSVTLKMQAVCFSIISEGMKLCTWCKTHKTTRNLNSNCCGSLRTCSVHM